MRITGLAFSGENSALQKPFPGSPQETVLSLSSLKAVTASLLPALQLVSFLATGVLKITPEISLHSFLHSKQQKPPKRTFYPEPTLAHLQKAG